MWMAENLNYRPQSGQSWCYNDSDSYCDKYGRLYNWETAKKVCPAGWHLPSPGEWEDLVTASGDRFAASYKLRAQSGWAEYFEGEEVGNDEGFAAMPGGYREYKGGGFHGIGYFGSWWSATEDGVGAYERSINCCGDDGISEITPNDEIGNSVRCVQNENKARKERILREEARINEAAAQRMIEMEQKCKEEERQRKEAEEQEIAGGGQGRFEKTSTYFTDSRDGRKYRAVKIGANTWMAQNMNYQPNSGKSWCYGDSGSYCDKYGRLYDWKAAENACPAGWRLPSTKDWGDLMQAAGGKFKRFELYPGWLEAGAALKTQTGWGCYKGKNGNGADAYGFSALPGGQYYDVDGFNGVGIVGTWWTVGSYRHARDDRDCSYMAYHSNHVIDFLCQENDGNSVRCVADTP